MHLFPVFVILKCVWDVSGRGYRACGLGSVSNEVFAANMLPQWLMLRRKLQQSKNSS
uniref:Uncharacterized protein n=1 Tax=Anguilla anguilla TaxID=7936 RepID=A0A0E9V4F8_ANGAN